MRYNSFRSCNFPFLDRNKIMSMFKTVTSNIGIDITKSSIKMSQFKRDSLTRVAYKEIPVSVRRGSGDEFLQFISKSISALVKEENFGGRNVSSNLTGPSEVNLLFFTLPRMEKKDLEGAVSMEVKKEASFPIENSVYDFYSRDVQYHEDELRIISAVSNREVINNKIGVLESSGLLTLRIDIVGHAIENLLKLTEDLPESRISLFLDIDTNVTTMNFFSGNLFQFSRELPFGSDDLTSSIARSIVTSKGRVNLSFEDAEALKKEYGIIKDDSKEMIRDSIPASQLSAMMRPFVEKVSREVSHSINHFRRQFNAKVGKIFLYGGAAKLKGLDEILRDNLGIEVTEFDPFEKIAVQLPDKQKELFENCKLDFVVSAGLALGEKRKFNILPVRTKLLYKLSTVRTGITVGLLLFAVTLLLSHFAVCVKVKNYQELLRTSESYLAPLKDELKAMDELKKWEERVEDRRKSISKIGRQPLWHGVLKELSNIIPEGIILESISLAESGEEMGLNIKGNLTSEESAFSKFLINLNDSPFFKDVMLISRREKNEEIGFELRCNLVY